MAAPQQISERMQVLSSYIAGALRKPLPRDVAERAKLHLLDTLAAIVSGSRLVPGKLAIGYAKTLGGTKEAGVIGTRISTTAVNAALINGICAHADETDDINDPGNMHPGASVVPAALALSERYRYSGSTLLRAMALGYDVGTRVTLSLVPLKFMFTGHHPPSFSGVFGAAGAAGALLRLNPERVRYMLSYTAQQAGGLSSMLRDPHHAEKAFGMGGMTAHNGVQAALLAAHGFTGVSDVFSGENNFFFAFAREHANLDELTRELGRTYAVMSTSIKKWPVGGPVLAPLDAIETLRRKDPFGAEDVEKLVVTVAKEKADVVNNRAIPDINIQHLVAVMLLDGRVTFKSSHDFRRMSDPKVLKLKQRIELLGSAEMTSPQRRRNGEVQITLRDGRTLKLYVHAARGSNENPLTREEEDIKAFDLLGPVLGKQRAAKLIDTVWNIEKVTDVRKLRNLYRA